MPVGRGVPGVCADAHASVPGTVVRIESWEDGEGRRCEGVLVRMKGSFDRLGTYADDGAPEIAPASIGLAGLLGALDGCGVVEMEDSGRPLSAVIRAFLGTAGGQGDTLVVRCVMDDPWQVADHVLCRERMRAVVLAAFAVAGACGLGRVVLAFSRATADIGRSFIAEADVLRGSVGVSLPVSAIAVGEKYPQRNARELALAVREWGRASGIEPGAILPLGPVTLAAVYDALRFRRPPLERYVAVGGSAVRTPAVMRARIGKRVGDLFDECGGFVAPPVRIVRGSPFFGERVRFLDEPVTRTTHALAAMLGPQIGAASPHSCISCGECRWVCPVDLDPEAMYKTVMVSRAEGGAPHPGFADCHGCGCCELVCPSRLPIAETVRGVSLEGGYA